MDLQPPANLPLGPVDPPQTGPIPPVPSPIPPPPAPMPVPPPLPPVAPPTAPPIQAMPSTNPADDMFSGVERAAPTPSPISSNPSAPVPPIAPPAPSRVLPPLPESTHPPVLHYILIALAVVIVLGVIAGAVWFFAIRRPARQVMETLPEVPAMTSSTDTVGMGVSTDAPVDEPLEPDVTFGEPEVIPSKPVVTPPAGTNVPFPNTIDPNAPSPSSLTANDVGVAVASGASSSPSTQPSTDTGMMMQPTTTPASDQDGDGLSDARETELGTNFAADDTDGDALRDGDEVLKYRTNPLIPDTDGDTFPDGVEVQKGYNPLGPGKCANPACTL